MKWLILLLPLFAFGYTPSNDKTADADFIKSVNQSDTTVLNDLKIDSYSGSFVLQSSAGKAIEESATTNTELSYLSGVTSAIQGQINAKEPTLPNTTDGDLLYYNSGQAALGIGISQQYLRVSALGFPEWADFPVVSPLTTAGDIYYFSTINDRLPVGTNGQLLSVNTALGGKLEWIDAPSSSPTTTQGDLILRGVSEDERLPIGTTGKLLTSNGTTASWEDAPVSTTLTTKGDIQTFDSVNARLAVGTDGQFLVADSAEATGLKYSSTLQGSLNPVSNWETCTVTGSWVTNTSYTCKQMRVGQNINLDIRVDLSGTPTSASLEINMPSGVVIDTVAMTGYEAAFTQFNASVNIRDNGTTVYNGFAVAAVDGTKFRIKYDTGSGTNAQVTEVAPITFVSGDFIEMKISNVPVVGWSSGIDAVSQFKVPLKIEANNNAGVAIAASTDPIVFTDEVTDNKNAFTGGTTFTVPTGYAGRYHINGQLFANASILSWTTRIRINGANTKSCGRNDSDTILPFSCYVDLNDGDTLQIVSGDAFTPTVSTDLHYLSIEQQPSSFNIAAPIDSQKITCETNYLTANVTANTTTIADLTATTTIGKKYSVFMQGFFNYGAAGDTRFDFRAMNNGNEILRIGTRDIVGGTNIQARIGATNPCVTAGATTITFDTLNLIGSGRLDGTNTFADTWISVCQLPDNYECN